MLKFSYRSFTLLILFAATTAASAATLLVKNTSPGFVMQEYAVYTTCSLDDQGMLVMTSRLNGLSSRKTVPEQFSVGSIRKAIAEAASGNIKTPERQIADTPSSTYHAYHRQSGGKVARVFLYEDNGNPDINTYNESPAAMSLRNFMDAICK
jgi:hypothetical protein